MTLVTVFTIWKKLKGLHIAMQYILEKCGCELGYFRSLAFAQKKWSYHKAFHLIPPSVWLKAMFSDEPFLHTLLATSQNREVVSGEKLETSDGEIWKEFLENPHDTSVPFLSN